jgi:hypothetical protein
VAALGAAWAVIGHWRKPFILLRTSALPDPVGSTNDFSSPGKGGAENPLKPIL